MKIAVLGAGAMGSIYGGHPVSYTHLDVYKRQGYGICIRGRT